MTDKQIKVLLIEDEPGDARLIRVMMSKADGPTFTMEHVDRLSTGLECLAAGGIDVVLLDLGLPDSSGLDTFIKVHTQVPDVPIIMLTVSRMLHLQLRLCKGVHRTICTRTNWMASYWYAPYTMPLSARRRRKHCERARRNSVPWLRQPATGYGNWTKNASTPMSVRGSRTCWDMHLRKCSARRLLT
ncbi:MAG: response regulator [Euryarchaeota archaeon]|nr:response regulator [Euryarchaeota archaeon]